MNQFLRPLLVTALVASSPMAAGQDEPSITHYELDNGLEVALLPDRRVPKVAVGIYYRVGGLNEPVGRSGFAHLFEHLMFMGTPTWPEFDAAFLAIGVDSNAWTWDNETFYWNQGLNSTLPVILSLEADRMANLGAEIDQDELDLQRDVVINEMRESVLDEAGQAATEALWSGLFPPGHPYSRAVIGSIPDLEAARLPDVKAFFDRFYAPNNAVLVITGDFDTEATQALVEATFGQVPRGEDVTLPDPAPFAPTRIRLELEDAIPEPRVSAGFTGPKPQEVANGAMLIAAELLGNQDYGVLRQALVNTGLAASAEAEWTPGLLGGRFVIDVGAAGGVDAEALETGLRETLTRFLATDLEADDLERARAKVLLDARIAKEPLRDRAELVAMWLGQGYPAETALADHPQVKAASLDEIQVAVRSVLALDRASWAVVTPGGRGDYPAVLSQSTGEPEPIEVAARPQVAIPVLGPAEPGPVVLPSAETAALANGIAVVHYAVPGSPLAFLAATVTGGRTSDPAGQEGLFELAATLATRGAGARGFAEFSQAASDIGAEIWSRSEDQRTMLALSVVPENFGGGVSLLADAVQTPRLSETEWDVLVAETTDQLLQRESDLPDVARRTLELLMFPAQPGEPAVDRSLAALRNIGLDDVRGAFGQLFSPETMTLYSVGPLPLEEMLPVLEARFGKWRSESPGVPARPHISAQFPPERHVFVVPDTGASQTAIAIGRPAPGYQEAGYGEAIATMRLLGEDFISRLNAVIREEKGYSYGVSADFWQYQPRQGALLIEAPVEREVTGASMVEFIAGIEGLASRPVEAHELNRSIAAYQTALAGIAETAGGLFDQLLAATGHGTTLEDSIARQEAITRLELAAVQAEAKAIGAGRGEIVVLAGDPELISAQLAEIGIDDVTVLAREADPLDAP